MQVSVVIPTYKRGWALQYSLLSLNKQTIPTNEVVIVLKPSGDKSEEIINKIAREMPIKLIVQREGFFIDAVEMGIKNAHGDIILFMDDDAIAERENG